MDLQGLGRVVEQLREQAGLTQVEVAESAKLSPSYISRLERGQVNPKWTDLLVLMRALGVSPAMLIPPESLGSNPASEKLVNLFDRHPDIPVALSRVSDDLDADDAKFLDHAINFIGKRHE